MVASATEMVQESSSPASAIKLAKHATEWWNLCRQKATQRGKKQTTSVATYALTKCGNFRLCCRYRCLDWTAAAG